MEYTASLVSKPFWYLESRETAKYILNGYDRDALKKTAVEENIYQVNAEYRIVEIVNTTYARLTTLPPELIRIVAEGDRPTAKALLLLSIMKSDRLFFEFMYEVFRVKMHLHDFLITVKDLNAFFSYKATQSEKVAGWSDASVKKLKSAYMRLLFLAELATETKEGWMIQRPLIDSSIQALLESNGMKPYLSALIGGD